MNLFPSDSSPDEQGYVSIFVQSFSDVDVKILLDKT